VPTYITDAERGLIGALLARVSGQVQRIGQAAEVCGPEDFYTPSCRRVFRAVLSLTERHQPIDVATVVDELRQIGPSDPEADQATVLALLGAGELGMVPQYAEIVATDARRRREAAELTERLAALDARVAAPREGPRPAVDDEYHRVVGGGMAMVQKDGTSRRLTNFDAYVVTELWREVDAGEPATVAQLEVEAALPGCEPVRFLVPLVDFGEMKWAQEHLGPAALVDASTKTSSGRAATAILTESRRRGFGRRTHYARTGWLDLPTGGRVYLHAGGAIGGEGSVDGLRAELPDPPFSGYYLPDPPAPGSDELDRAARAVLRLLDAAPVRLTAPVLCVALRAPLGRLGPVTLIAGPKEAGKTSLALAVQQLYGSGFRDEEGNPSLVSFAATANASEKLGWHIADALLVTDDFGHRGSTWDHVRADATADRLVRASYDGATRERLSRDAEGFRPSYRPRGAQLWTGEDVPAGESLASRMLVLPMERGDLNAGVMAEVRQAGDDGTLAGCMAAYLSWLARQEESPAELRRRAVRELVPDTAGRLERATSELAAAAVVFARFLREATSLTAEVEAAGQRIAEGLAEAAEVAEDSNRDEEPVDWMRRLLDAALRGGARHLVGQTGAEPLGPEGADPDAHAQRRGWWREGSWWRRSGRPIGVDRGDVLHLLPELTHAAVREMAKAEGREWPYTVKATATRLKQAGWLIYDDEKGSRHVAPKRVLPGLGRKRVWEVPARFLDDDAGNVGHPGGDGGDAGHPGPQGEPGGNSQVSGGAAPPQNAEQGSWSRDECPDHREGCPTSCPTFGEQHTPSDQHNAPHAPHAPRFAGHYRDALCVDVATWLGELPPARLEAARAALEEAGWSDRLTFDSEDEIRRIESRVVELMAAGSISPETDDETWARLTARLASLPDAPYEAVMRRVRAAGWAEATDLERPALTQLEEWLAEAEGAGGPELAPAAAQAGQDGPQGLEGAGGPELAPAAAQAGQDGPQGLEGAGGPELAPAAARAASRYRPAFGLVDVDDAGVGLWLADGQRVDVRGDLTAAGLARLALAHDLRQVRLLPAAREAADLPEGPLGAVHPFRSGADVHSNEEGAWLTVQLPDDQRWVGIALGTAKGDLLPTGLGREELGAVLERFGSLVGIDYWSGPGATFLRLLRALDGRPSAPKPGPSSPLPPALEVAVGDVRWARRLLPTESRRQWIVAFDRNSHYLAAAGSVALGLGKPEHLNGPDVTFDRALPGWWRAEVTLDAGDDLSPPLLRPHDGWWTTPMLDWALEQGVAFTVAEAWVHRTHRRALAASAKVVRQGLGQLGDEPTDAGVRRMLKGLYTVGLGSLAAGYHRPGAPHHRPDWRSLLIDQATANMGRALAKAAAVEVRPFALLVDCAFFAVEQQAARLPGLRMGSTPGTWKPAGAVRMQDYLAATTAGEDRLAALARLLREARHG